ncbi:MAG: RNA 2',3'-cyclic phosphodiesterase [Candidatus Rokubacteria bacterium]|nr:RNA 2',3'-cyclic phosphodiesterase [Candidatus Rokubacteria bacterium]
MTAAVRSFVAVLLDPDTRAALGTAIERLRRAGRGVAWVVPDNLHVTLKFLGQVDEARLGEVASALAAAAAGVAAFDFVVQGLGAFPSVDRPRVVWAGAGEGAGALVTLASRVEEALGPLGFAAEARPFSPHVTLGRLRAPRRDPALAAALGASPGQVFGRIRAARVSLMRSDLSPRGARYSELAAAALGV